jgi:hypothetical protein
MVRSEAKLAYDSFINTSKAFFAFSLCSFNYDSQNLLEKNNITCSMSRKANGA